MPTLTLPGDTPIVIEAAPGRKLVLALEDGGIDILHRCGGIAKCATCRVKILSGEPSPMTKAERRYLTEDGLLGVYRLACQARVSADDLTLHVACRAHRNGVPPGPRPAEE